ncbi:MAG: aminoacyl-tRNA hydrolase [Rickettsiales bacterium]|jgi:PTH1 family peptidyl-tRNA hydrolase|nr:aminoacyl-tRNA hydrolase [Rickettsiales bacterium]
MDNDKPILIAGLGNPGAEYSRTRHNVGFMAIDALAGGDADWKKEKNALTTRITNRESQITILAKPQTFMNNSGIAVAALMAFYKIPLGNLIVIHDDMDIKQGNVRTKIGGGSAGHNGIKSIDAAVGNEYRRIRIGIGHPRDFDSPISPHDWVLNRFSEEEMKLVQEVIKNIADKI